MSKKELISIVKTRYLKASKREKTGILDEFCQSTGYARKYAIAILAAGYDNNRVAKVGRKARKKKYSHEIMAAVVKLWEVLDFPCGQRLKPTLPEMYATLVRFKEMTFNEAIRDGLETISAKTLDRRLEGERKRRRLKRNRGLTCRGNLLKSSIPIRITDWDIGQLGYAEIDTVAHNGGDPGGEFIFTLDLTEIFSGWSEQEAVMGKSETGVLKAIKDIQKDLPFNLLGIDGDNGGEIVNYQMLKYCTEEKLVYTRRRPDRKNDNAYVEQKNHTHVRQLVGYVRYDTRQQFIMLNALYRREYRLFTNFFRPVMKIKSKEKINNSICRKKYDIAQSPYQRLLNCDQLSRERKDELTRLYLSLNPLQLKRRSMRKSLN
ncbi:MAG: transposase [Patescibacteria group bacterium]